MWFLYFKKFFFSENYTDDFEDEEDIDAPLTTKDEETNSKENPESQKINESKQVYINYTFDSFETTFIILAVTIWRTRNTQFFPVLLIIVKL